MMKNILIATGLLALLTLTGCVTMQQPVEDGATQSVVTNSGATAKSGAIAQNGMAEASDLEAAVKGFVLKPLDPIFVRFSGVMDQQTLDLVIDENGEISLLHLRDPVKAAGLTPSKLEKSIEHLYVKGGIYKNVTVNVTMTAKVYYVQGEVNAPGQFQLSAGTTLLQAIAGARGYTPFADKRKVTITRAGRVIGRFNTKVLEKKPSMDVKIESGDVIKVPDTWY